MRKIIYGIILMILPFIAVDNVEAADTVLRTCTYTINLKDVAANAPDSDISFVIDVTDGTSATIPDLGYLYTNDKSGGNYVKFRSSTASKYNAEANSNNNCPTLVSYLEETGTSIQIQLASLDLPAGVSASTLAGESDDETTSEKVEMCSFTKAVPLQNYDATFIFYTLNDTKYWSISISSSNGITEGISTKSLTVDTDKFILSSKASTLVYGESNCSGLTLVSTENEDKSYTITTSAATVVDNGTDTTDANETITCGELTDIPKALPVLTSNLITLIKILVPIILIIMGMLDFGKAMAASDEKAATEARNKFVRRVIASVIVFLAVTIVQFILSALGATDNNALTGLNLFVNGTCEAVEDVISDYEACLDRAEVSCYASCPNEGEGGNSCISTCMQSKETNCYTLYEATSVCYICDHTAIWSESRTVPTTDSNCYVSTIVSEDSCTK